MWVYNPSSSIYKTILYDKLINQYNFFRFSIIFSGLEDMKARRYELQNQIDSQETEKTNLQQEIEKMTYKLTKLNESLGKKIAVRNDYDRTIADTEAAYVKVIIACIQNCHYTPIHRKQLIFNVPDYKFLAWIFIYCDLKKNWAFCCITVTHC